MKIRTLLIATSTAIFLLTSAVGAVAYVATNAAARIREQGTKAAELQGALLEMNVLAQTYVLWHEERPKRQWYVLYERLTDQLENSIFDGREVRKLADELRLDAEKLRSAFDELSRESGARAPDAVVERQIAGDLLVQSQRMVTIADRLARQAMEERARMRARADNIIFGLLAVLAAAALGAIAVVYRQIAGPVLKLQKGAKIIGKGDLDYRVGAIADGEIGQLARAFDQMAGQLKRSRDTLEEKVRDRTKEIEELSKKSEIMLRSIGDGVIAIDKEWTITLWNPVAADITGWSKEEAVGKPLRSIAKFVRKIDRTENILFVSDAMIEGKTHFMENDTVLVRKDGSEVDVADSAAPIVDDHGRVTGAIIVFRDNTKEKELEKSKNDLVSLVTHELRGPATIIRGYLELFHDQWGKELTEEQRAHLAKISAANDKMVELGNSLLSVFRVDFEETNIAPEPTDIRDIADEVLKQQELALAQKKLRLETRYDDDLPVLAVDRNLTELVFTNLLTNAVKYSRDGGTVMLKILRNDGEVRIVVADEGVGIPKAEQEKIFTKFFRATNVRTMSGVGVGLHVLKAMLERAGCRIWFESEEGKGSTFSVAIPISGMARIGGAT